MRIACAYDKTITESPKKVGNLLYELFKANNHIFIFADSLYKNLTENKLEQQLRMKGLYPNEHYRQLIILEDIMQDGIDLKKAQFCRDEGVDMLFDGSEKAIKTVNDISVRTVCWQIKPTGWD